MLIDFSVENFLSFKDRVTLNLVSASRDKSLPQNKLKGPQTARLDLLKSAVVYGANASGKSNLYRAFETMQSLVRNSATAGEGYLERRIKPFKLDVECHSKPSTFEVVFVKDQVRYNYGFSVDTEVVCHEWLYSYPKNHPRLLFERSIEKADSEPRFNFGPSWKGERRKLVKMTRPDALFISVATQFNHKMAQTIYEFFNSGVIFYSRYKESERLRALIKLFTYKFKDIKKSVREYLALADLGINDFQVRRVPIEKTEQIELFPDVPRAAITNDDDKELFHYIYEVITIHKGSDADGEDLDVQFSLDEESDGTRQFFNLSVPCIVTLTGDTVLVVDELDASLHPLLTKWIINNFNSKKANPRGAQLIFTTHDSGLLEGETFRRDQIWFTEKNIDGATELYSLWDYQKVPRKQENIRRGYLAGRYGAIPILEDAS
jgi:AAA15 family ATPase/GTPase